MAQPPLLRINTCGPCTRNAKIPSGSNVASLLLFEQFQIKLGKYHTSIGFISYHSFISQNTSTVALQNLLHYKPCHSYLADARNCRRRKKSPMQNSRSKWSPTCSTGTFLLFSSPMSPPTNIPSLIAILTLTVSSSPVPRSVSLRTIERRISTKGNRCAWIDVFPNSLM